MMEKIPFKVSARTARLIGRENIASSKGAIIELVKNAYDADSPVCIIYFDNKSPTNTLYIIDAGEGMTLDIIKNHWMTIGTDNKAENIFTKTGRIKAGAKGIGRFALDKLGNKTEMITWFNPKVHEEYSNTESGYHWKVNWSDFEGEFKTIDSVNAELNIVKSSNIQNTLKKNIDNKQIIELLDKYYFQYGTVLKITELRDNWDDFYIEQIFSDLEVLIPPKEDSSFDVYLFSSLKADKYGEVLASICDDYDYKLVAKTDEKQNVSITIYRNEFDIDIIDPVFFKRKRLSDIPYDEKTFKKGYWETEKTLGQLLPGFANIDKDNIFNNIGTFEFTLYFMKKTFTTPDANKYFYKKFNSNERKNWLNKFGGIKLFRDNFRVRPYGEVKDSAFDWLNLGERKTRSPAGIAKKGGGYRIAPENIAGIIKISRLINVNFEDKSSREGLQENKTFQIFKLIIAGIIDVFEKDRAYIFREMSDYYNQKYSDEISKEQAEQLAKEILDKERNRKETTDKPSEEVILAKSIEDKNEEIEKLEDEQKILRALASSGIVLASFSHDLSKLSNILTSRIDKLKQLISDKISPEQYVSIEDRKNPFYQLEKMRKQDVKLQNWLKFSLGAARKDKRRRKNLNFSNYFNNFKTDWTVILKSRGIQLVIEHIDKVIFRVFEIDIDSIFNNLLVNSIDAFNISTIDRDREINIEVRSNNKEILINYFDNGPGLSKDIENPETIFNALFTTKRNKYTGDEEGTGLGMWLVKSIVNDNSGNVKLLYPKTGFGIRITFPLRYRKN